MKLLGATARVLAQMISIGFALVGEAYVLWLTYALFVGAEVFPFGHLDPNWLLAILLLAFGSPLVMAVFYGAGMVCAAPLWALAAGAAQLAARRRGAADV
jgi:hypothetical protein